MHPILFKFFGIPVYTYGLMVAIGIAFALLILVRLSLRCGIDTTKASDIAFWTIITGFIGARVLYFIYNPEYLNPFWRILYLWEGGLVWYGGVVSGFVTAFFLCRRKGVNPWKLADIASIAGSVGLAFGRIGCTMAGCCYGKVCHSKFSIVFRDPASAAPINVPLCPTQPLSAVANFAIAFLLYRFFVVSGCSGRIAGYYLVIYGIFRFLIEFMRATPKVFYGMSINQIISVIMVVAGLAVLKYLSLREAY